MKKKGIHVFPSCIHIVSWEKENASSEALEATRTAYNRYMTKFIGKDTFHRSSLSAPDPAPRPIVHPGAASMLLCRFWLRKRSMDWELLVAAAAVSVHMSSVVWIAKPELMAEET
ncbi:hypothetical protein ACFX12_029953 [Malus domestica]